MEIQRTTVSELEGQKAQIEMQISDHKDLEQSSQHVVCSVLVSTEVKPPLHDPISFRILQTRALKQAVALLGQVGAAKRPQQT